MPFDIALSGLNAAQTNLDVIANNVANSSTNGFKKSRAEFADVYAWLATLASLHGVDLVALGQAKYGAGCPRCTKTPCSCH